MTPKAARELKLKDLKRRVQAKKGLYNSSEEDDMDEEEPGLNSEDEDNLPMFENEEELPEEALSGPADEGQDQSDLDDFVVNDDVVEMDENGDGHSEEVSTSDEDYTSEPKTKPKKRKQKQKNDDDEEASTDDDYDYANPYKAMDDKFEKANIMDILRIRRGYITREIYCERI